MKIILLAFILASIGLINGEDSTETENEDYSYDVGNIEQKRDTIVPSCYYLGITYVKKCRNGASCSFDPLTKYRCNCAKGFSGWVFFFLSFRFFYRNFSI